MPRPSIRRATRRALSRMVRPIVQERAEVAAEAAALRDEVDRLEHRVTELVQLVGEVGQALREPRS